MSLLVRTLLALCAACALAPLHAAESGGDSDLFVQAMRALSEGRRGEASALVERMAAANPDNASEWLDLAMIQCSLGRAEEAQRLFRIVEERYDPPPGIRELINEQRAGGCRRPAARKQFALVLGRGVDRNVNQGASNPAASLGGTGGPVLELDPEFLPQRDQYSSLSASFGVEVGERGAVLFGQAAGRRNDSLRDYDTASLFGGIEYPWTWGAWRLRATAFGGALTLGGRLYQEQAQLQLRTVPPLPLPKGMEASVTFGRAHANYKTLTNFDSDTDEVRLGLTRRGRDTQWQVNAGTQSDHATGTRPGGDRRGWSMTASSYHRLGAKWQGELDLSRQIWRGQTVYAPQVFNIVRRQDTRVARAALIYLLDERQSLQLEGRRVRNQDNISIFDYNNTIWQLSWQWNGF